MFFFDLKFGYYYVEIFLDYRKYLLFVWIFFLRCIRFFQFFVFLFGFNFVFYLFILKLFKFLVKKWRFEVKLIVVYMEDGFGVVGDINDKVEIVSL